MVSGSQDQRAHGRAAAEASNRFFAAQFATARVMGIFRGHTPERTIELCARAWDAGVVLVEVPMTGSHSLAALEAAVEAGRQRGGVCVGAGTVTRPDQVDEVIGVGAQFTVAPGLHPAAVERSLEQCVPHLPGVANSSEVAASLAYGYQWVKVFPAAQLGADWVRAQHGPFPEARFVATGGMTIDNADEFFTAGCAAVALGSAFADPSVIDAARKLR